MERKISGDLLKWKNDIMKKPIFLYGISGCGKSYTVLEFGKSVYKNVIYFNCDNNLELNYVFDKNNTLDKLIRALSAISLETIFKEESLIVFDNVTDKVMDAVRKLFAGVSSYHIIMISDSSSLLKKSKSDFSVKKMNLVSFPEYLSFLGKDQLISFIEDSFKNNKSMPFHSMAMECYNDYVLTGGYPNAIVSFNENKDYNMLSNVHNSNIAVLKNKFFDMNNLIDIRRGIEVYDNMSLQLLKENKKFMYGLIKNGARAKEYENAIKFMEEDGMVIKSFCINEITSPISRLKDEDNFKLYYNDSGLLYSKLNVSANRLLTNDKLMLVLYENNIVSTINQMGYGVYFYHSTGKAYLDLVMQTRNGKIIPIEILGSEVSTKSKSLALALAKFNLDFAIRFTENNFREKKGIKYIPYYAAFMLDTL